jgi:hypothetical protein
VKSDIQPAPRTPEQLRRTAARFRARFEAILDLIAINPQEADLTALAAQIAIWNYRLAHALESVAAEP